MNKKLLERLCEITQIAYDDDTAVMVTTMQKNWLRSTHKELSELEERFSEKERSEIWEIAKQLGFVSEKIPKKTTFEQCALLGGMLPCFQHRLHYLIELWSRGVRFKNWVFLAGQRKLLKHERFFKDLDSPKNLVHNEEAPPENEGEMMQLYYQRATLPAEMRLIPFQLINLPMRSHQGKKMRPTTADTIRAWAKNQQAKNCLFVTDQPFCLYQEAVIEADKPSGVSFEIVGAHLRHSHFSATAFLDTFARYFYQTFHNHIN